MARVLSALALLSVTLWGCGDEPREQPPICEYMGMTYEVGETWPAGDGCNTCHCLAPGNWGCALVACHDAGPDASAEVDAGPAD